MFIISFLKRNLKKIISTVIILGVLAGIGVAVYFKIDDIKDILGIGKEKEPITYEITYATENGIKTMKVEDNKLFVLNKLPEKTGYTFTGLYSEEVGGTQYVNANGLSLAPFTDKSDLVLHAQFVPKEYTIEFMQDSDTLLQSFDYKYGDTIMSVAPYIDEGGYNFNGWYTSPGGMGKKVVVGTKLDADNFDVKNSKIRLFPYLTIMEFDVTLYILDNGVYNEKEKIKVDYGTPIDSIKTNYMSDGREIIGWSFSQGSSPSSDIITSDRRLYSAKYINIITFDSNGGNDVYEIKSESGKVIDLPEPVREEYKFLNWIDEDEYIVDSKYTVPNRNVKLTAQWKKVVYQIRFDTNGGNDLNSIKVTVGESYDFRNLPKPKKNGYKFKYWQYKDGEYVKDDILMNEEDINLVAVWVVCFAVSFDTQGGNYIESILEEQGEIIILNKPVKTDYRFLNWIDDEGNIVGSNYTVPDRNVVLTAQWKRVVYQIRFDTNGGSNVNSIKFNIEEGYNCKNLPKPVREDYIFLNWVDDEGNIVDSNFTVSDRDVVLTAQWKKNVYQIKLNVGDNKYLDSVKVTVGENYNYKNLPEPKKDGNKFKCWQYKSGEEVNKNILMKENDLELFAVWLKIYKITYVTQYKELNENPTSYTEEDEIIFKSLPNNNDYYVFSSWDYGEKINRGTRGDLVIKAKYSQKYTDYTYISTKEQFTNIKNDTSKNYMLINDIDFVNATWTPIDKFSGTIDGRNFTIKNLQIKSTSDGYAALFVDNSGVISNLKIDSANVYAVPDSMDTFYSYAAVIACRNKGTINECTVSNSTIISDANKMSKNFKDKYGVDSKSLVQGGKYWYEWIRQAEDRYATIGGNYFSYAGAICSINNGTIDGCNSNSNTVQSNVYYRNAADEKTQYSYAGGICGSNYCATIKNCSNNNSVVSTYADLFDKGGDLGWAKDIYPSCEIYAGQISGKFTSSSLFVKSKGEESGNKKNGKANANYRIFGGVYFFLEGHRNYAEGNRAKSDKIITKTR